MNLFFRRLRALSPLALLLPLAAQAMSIDPQKLARYDLSYAQCEQQNPQMKGHGDEAWLAMWRVPADPKSLAQVAKARKSARYKAAHDSALKAAPNGVLPASSPLAQQCQALWSDLQKTQQLQRSAKAAASQPGSKP